MDSLLPSEWDGNYTCDDDGLLVHFIMNFTHSSLTIDLLGDMFIQGHMISTVGTFASWYHSLTLQTDSVIQDEINSRNFTKVELNGIAHSSVYINGVIVFWEDMAKTACDMEMRRKRGMKNSIMSSFFNCLPFIN